MGNPPVNRHHNGNGLSLEEQRKLWDHVRAREALNEQMDEVRLDISARKELIKADGFDVNMVEAIIKRRKAGEGETQKADSMIRIYEEGLREQGALPLEKTRTAAPPARRSLDEIAKNLHGQDLPEMPERPDIVDYGKAKQLVIDSGKASASHLQRVFEVGYNQAARWIEQMEAEGVVSRPDAVGVRKVLVGQPKNDPPGGDDDNSLIDPF